MNIAGTKISDSTVENRSPPITASAIGDLQAAARVGIAALDRGEFREFETVEGLRAYLNDLSEKVSSRTRG